MKSLLSALALAASLSGIGSATAQIYPARAITIVAPFPAGGPSDVLARILSEPLRAALGQPVVIENVAGAGGNIGVGRVARAAPDGYTLVIGQWSTHVVNPVTYTLAYDVMNDFEPIALLANTPQLIIARKDFPASDVHDLIAWLKGNPDLPIWRIAALLKRYSMGAPASLRGAGGANRRPGWDDRSGRRCRWRRSAARRCLRG